MTAWNANAVHRHDREVMAMYGVFSRRTAILVLICTAAVLCSAVGLLGRAVTAGNTARELPVYSVETDEKTVALGINCAWDDSDIDQLLSLLEAHDVKATFFIVGDWADKYPEAVQRIAQAGHEVGSHSDTHPDMTKLDRAGIERELETSGEKLERLSGKQVRLFRAPSGAYNNLVVATARALGWEVVQWSNDSIDWKTPPVEEMVEKVCGRAAPGDIMLWHAGKANTPAALEQVIDRLSEAGYSFVPVGELLLPPPYRLDHTGRQFPAETGGEG